MWGLQHTDQPLTAPMETLSKMYLSRQTRAENRSREKVSELTIYS